MGHFNYKNDSKEGHGQHAAFQESLRFQREKQNFDKDRKRFEQKQRQFEKRVRDFEIQQSVAKRQKEQDERIFQFKWNMLESELVKMADEKARLEREKEINRAVAQYKQPDPIEPGLLFKGIKDPQSLKKRYKDLIKIFHPDNASGDADVLMAIRKEYELLKSRFAQ